MGVATREFWLYMHHYSGEADFRSRSPDLMKILQIVFLLPLGLPRSQVLVRQVQ